MPKNKTRGRMIVFRLQPAEAKEIEAAASETGKTRSDWIRDVVLTAARKS